MGEGGGVTPRKVSARVYRRRRTAAALALLLVGRAGAAGRRLGLPRVPVPPDRLGPRFRPWQGPLRGSVNLLVVGSDTRQGLRDGGFGDAAGQRSGVIIVVHLVPAGRLRRLPRGRRRPRRGLDDGDQTLARSRRPPAAGLLITFHNGCLN